MNVVDSSGWVEYFNKGTNANFFISPVQDVENLLVPAICLYEVFKRLTLDMGEESALQAAGIMSYGRIIELDRKIAIDAAQLSLGLKLAMADGIILATAREYNATLWTQDDHFSGMEGVQYIEKNRRSTLRWVLRKISEERTCKEMIDLQLERAGWYLRDHSRVKIEIPACPAALGGVDGYDAEPWNGVTDYTLYRENGEVLAVVEAKKTAVDVRLAEAQLTHYVTEIEKHQSFRPFGFLANGLEIHFVDVGHISKCSNSAQRLPLL
jgi:predicted nucleic acid-binding protein